MPDIRIDREGGSDLPPENLGGGAGAGLPAGHALPGGPEGRLDVAPAGGRIADAGHLLPERAGRGEPGQIAAVDDPDLARAEIEATRRRMSSTIDEIEEVLLRKKERLQERMDVLGPARETVRERPLALFGGVFAAGLVLGYLTGGGDEERARPQGLAEAEFDLEGDASYGRHWRERARSWEKQARRLTRELERRDAELAELRGRAERASARRRHRLEVDGGEDGGGPGWREALAGTLAGAFTGLFRRGGGEEVEVEFTPDASFRSEVDGEEGFGVEAAYGDEGPYLEAEAYGESAAGPYGGEVRPYDDGGNDAWPGNQLPA